MKIHATNSFRLLAALVALGFLLGGAGPFDFVPSAEAATSAQKRKLRKFKRKARRFEKQTRILRRRLVAALLPDPAPPLLEMVNSGQSWERGGPVE